MSDPDLRSYLEDCIGRIPGIQLLLPDTAARPDLLVTDVYDPRFRDEPELGGIPRLHVLDEPPVVGKSEPIEFVLTPFDSRSIAHAVLRVLRQHQPWR